MSNFLYIIVLYLLVLFGLNIYRARKVKSGEDFMVAGRSLDWKVMVFTLVCTWIGSGTFIAGAEFAYKAGLSSLWLPAGAWFGILIIYFLSAKIRKFGQFTIGDILETRYSKWARLVGAIAIIISFVSIVSYQFRAGGLILNILTQGKERASVLQLGDGSSIKVFELEKYGDKYLFKDEKREQKEIPISQVKSIYAVGKISVEQGQLISAIFVVVFTALAGMISVAYTDLSNGVIIVLACILSLPFMLHTAGGFGGMKANLPPEFFAIVNKEFGERPFLTALGFFFSTFLLLLGVQSMYQKFYSAKDPKTARKSVVFWILGTIIVETVVVILAVAGASVFKNLGRPETVVLEVATRGVPPVIGVLLLGAATVVVISTANNYLLSPSTNVIRDIYQRFINPNADQKRLIFISRLTVIVLGIIAYFLATRLQSVLSMAYFAYTIYGVAITPALIVALSWRRVTELAGLLSILGGTGVCVGLKIYSSITGHELFGIPLIFPSLLISVSILFGVSLATPPSSPEKWRPFFE
ncbi:MAG: sodium:solute symporter family protein [Candidatus Aminicenantia bacterium]